MKINFFSQISEDINNKKYTKYFDLPEELRVFFEDTVRSLDAKSDNYHLIIIWVTL